MIEIDNLGTTFEIEPSDKSQITRGIMRPAELLLSFRSADVLDLHRGASVRLEGITFTLYYPEEIRKIWRGYYDYTVTLHSSAEELRHRLVKDPSDIARTAFVFTGRARDFATLFARSMGKGWAVGECLSSEAERTIAFKEEDCLSALSRVAEDFGTEWVIDGKTIALRRDEEGKDHPLPMSYGKGQGFLSGVTRRGGSDLAITRLYVLGGSRNIDPTKYGASTLHLPASGAPDGMTIGKGGKYLELTGAEGAEGSVGLSEVYPSRVGEVSEVVTVDAARGLYDIVDKSIPETLNYSDCRIPGEKAVIRFLSGALAGRELEIRQSETALEGYHHEARRFELVQREEDGITFPSPSCMPKAGDRYAVFGISLPSEYVTRAEQLLLSEAARTLADRSRDRFTFEGEVDGIWARAKWLEIGGKLRPGSYILFSDPDFHPDGTAIRITAMTQRVNDLSAPSITLSTSPVGVGGLRTQIDRTAADEVIARKRSDQIIRLQKQDYRQALESLSMISRAVKEVEGYTARIKPSVVETMGLLVGSEAGHFDFVEAVGSMRSVPFVPLVEAERVVLPSAVLRHQTLGVKALSSKHRAGDFRYWILPEYTSPALSDGLESYYIYARVEREGSAGAFLLSREPISMEKEPGYYHLLVGTVSSVVDGSRAFNRLYGYSMLTPGALTVGAIESADGNMRIDLETGQISVKHLKIGPPDASKDLQNELADIPKWALEVYDVAAPLAPVILTEQRRKITLAYRVWRGMADLTDRIPATLISWHRSNPLEHDDTGTSDTAWENVHRHDRTITITKELITGEAAISVTAEAAELEDYYINHIK